MHTRRALLCTACAAALGGCAGLPFRGDPLKVNVVGVEHLPGEGMELRLALKLRVQNPNDTAIGYDGAAIELSVRGAHFASGVSDAKGEIPRFGERVLTVPVTVPPSAMLRQMLSMARDGAASVDYVLVGKLASGDFRSLRFRDEGAFDLPSAIGGR